MSRTTEALWGIDLGGTKIEGAIVQDGRAISRLRLPTNAAQGYDQIVSQVTRVIAMLEADSGIRRPGIVGVGTPGVTEPSTGKLKNSNTLCLNDRTLRDDLSRAVGAEVRLANDANCFALAEATQGAARGRDVVVGLILGTGVGSGVVVHGRLIVGRHGIAGEWGHNPLCGETTLCYCGQRGCIESVFAGPALERCYRERTGVARTLREIKSLADVDDPDAHATLRRLQEKFAEAVAMTINLLDPDAFVIGGGVGNLDILYSPETRELIGKRVFNPVVQTEFLRPALGDSAGVFGAAELALS